MKRGVWILENVLSLIIYKDFVDFFVLLLNQMQLWMFSAFLKDRRWSTYEYDLI